MSSSESDAMQRATKRQCTTYQYKRLAEPSRRQEGLNEMASTANSPDGKSDQTQSDEQSDVQRMPEPIIPQQQAITLQHKHDAAYTQLKPTEFCCVILRSVKLKTMHSYFYEPLEVEFQILSTEHEIGEEYEAISYVWGGCHHKIPTKNLYFALVALRGREDRRLWADALCINQKGDIERSQQVVNMSWIYQHAANVWIFIDGEPPRSTGADEYIRKMLNFTTQDEASSKKEREQLLAVSNLLATPWFSRRWVIQEIALARKATVIVSGFTSVTSVNWEMSWDDFADAVSLFTRRQAEIAKHLTPSGAHGFGESHASGAASLVDMINNLHRKDSTGQRVEILLDLESLLTKIPMFEVTQAHDIVYAILGLAKDTQNLYSGQQSAIPIDYNISPACLCGMVVRFIIQQSESLDILCRPWAPSRSDIRLPSWIATVITYPYTRRPDGHYHRQYADTLVGRPGLRANCYNAQRKLPCQSKPSVYMAFAGIETDELGVGEARYDKIQSTGERCINGNIPADWLTMGGWENVKDECPEDFWRTIVADRGPDGENAPGWYRRACQHVFRRLGNVDIDTAKMIATCISDDAEFLRRVQSVTWGRRLFRIYSGKLGLGPPNCQEGDEVFILHGCSVPVVLRGAKENHVPCVFQIYYDHRYTLVGECYIQGGMDAASDECILNDLATILLV